LCKQIEGYGPKKLLMADRNESGLHDINLQIREMYPHLETDELLCAVQNRELMNRLFSAHKPGVDIEIKNIGLRPGEKLYKELITAGEDVMQTQHKDIVAPNTDHHKAIEGLNALVEAAMAGDGLTIKQLLKEMAPEYTPEI
jgi:FlaA1/EpsC-like NDP-sugar epimerase